MTACLGLIANGLLIAGAWWLAGHGLRLATWLDRCLGASVLAFTWCLLGVEVLGTAGFLGIRTVLIASAVLFAIGLAARQLRPLARPEPSRDDTAGEPWSGDVLLALGLVAWTLAVLGMHSLLLPVKVVSDGPIYHLYFAARWWKAGRLFLVAAPFGESAATYFPANGDVWFTWLMVSWGGDRLAKVGQAPFLFLAAAAVFRMARTLGASRNSAIISTCWFVTSTPFLIFSFEPNVDTLFVAFYLIAVYFFLCYLRQESGTQRGDAGRTGRRHRHGNQAGGRRLRSSLAPDSHRSDRGPSPVGRKDAGRGPAGSWLHTSDLRLLVRPQSPADRESPLSAAPGTLRKDHPAGLVRPRCHAVSAPTTCR